VQLRSGLTRPRLLLREPFLEAPGFYVSPIEPTYLAANTAGMASEPEPPPPTSWAIYKIAAKAIWLGTVEAPDKQAAIKKGAREFKTEAWHLYAVQRR
jgi:hypothetical protein